MGQAVLCNGDGHSYDQRAISEWLQTHDTSPVTGQPLATKDLLPNHALRQLIEATC
jgi:U-box domain